jgi:hypothetical protein
MTNEYSPLNYSQLDDSIDELNSIRLEGYDITDIPADYVEAVISLDNQ